MTPESVRSSLAAIVGLLFLVLVIVGRVPVRYNVRSLLVRWRTTLLTITAFGLVVGLVMVMFTFVQSMYRVAAASGRPWNVMVLSDGATDELLSSLDYTATRDIEFHPGLARDRRGEPLASWELYIVITQPIAGSEDRTRRRFLQLRGVDDPARAQAVREIELHAGGAWFSGPGVRALPGGGTAIEAVLGEGIAHELGKDRGKDRLEVGEVFEAGLREWVVVGVLRSAGATYDAEIWAPRYLVGRTFGREGYTTLVLSTPDAETARALAQSLIQDYKKAPVEALVETDYYAKLNTTNRQFLQAAVVVTIILAVGGVFGLINAMVASVAQRAKDIGVLAALGFRRRQLFASFLFEVLVIAAIGGLLGCGLAAVADGWAVTSVVGSGQGTGKSVVLTLVIDREVFLTGMLLALGMGGVAGLMPAVAATRIRPADALR